MNPDDRQSYVSLSLFSFLENVMGTPRTMPDPPSPDTDLPPPPPPRPDVEAGGYPEEMFVFLSDREKEDYSCSVCYSILKDAHQCKNNHKFCYTCVYVWSTSPGDGSEFCPMCRVEGLYARNDIINTIIGRKRVKCLKIECNWRGQLIQHEKHIHRRYDDKELNKDFSLPAISSVSKARVPITSLVDSSHMSTSDFMRSLNRESTSINGNEDSPVRSPTPRLNPILSPLSSSTPSNSSSTITNDSSTTTTLTNSSARPTPTPPPTRRNSESNPPTPSTTDAQRRNSIGPRRIVRPNDQPTPRPSVSDNRSGTHRRDSLTRRDSVASNSSSTGNGPVNRPGLIPRPPAQTRPRTQNQAVNPAGRPVLANRNNLPSNVEAEIGESVGTSGSVPTSSASVNLNAIHFSSATSSSSATTTTVSSTSSRRPETPPAQRQLPPNPPVDSTSGAIPNEMVYRRLAPLRPRRNPQVQMGERLREGREQLALMLTLMTLELEERRRNIERHARETQERERIRLQEISEVQQLNRRLSVVTNNLERLLGSNQSRASSPPTLPSLSTSETRTRNSSLPPPRTRVDISFSGISGIGGMSDSSDSED